MRFRNVTTEVEEKPKIERDELFELVVRFNQELDKERRDRDEAMEKGFWNAVGRPSNISKRISKAIPEKALSPEQIELTLQKIIQMYPNIKSDCSIINQGTGRFVTQLINQSYKAGYNNFKLTTGNIELSKFGKDLIASKENPLNIEIQGNLEIYALDYTAAYTILTIKGHLRDWFQGDLEHCTIAIYGVINNYISSERASRCIFKTPNTETYEKLFEEFDETNNLVELMPAKYEILK